MQIDYSLIIVILNFILLLIVLNKILYAPLKNFLNERQQGILNDMEEAKASVVKAEQMVIEGEKNLKESINEGRKLKESLQKEAESEADKIIRAAKEQEKRTIMESQSQIELEKQQVILEIEKQISGLTVELAAKLLTQKMDVAADTALLNQMLQERGEK